MRYKVIITTTFLVDAEHPLLAAKAVRDNKAAVDEQDLYVFGELGALEFREEGTVRVYPKEFEQLDKEALDKIMTDWKGHEISDL